MSNQAKLGSENGIDLLLTCVAQYKSKDPAPGEEEEYMQNCFDVLCACLMQPDHKAAFVKVRQMRQGRGQGGAVCSNLWRRWWWWWGGLYLPAQTKPNQVKLAEHRQRR